MSEYADIRIRKMNLWSFRNYLDKDCVSLFFSKSDLEIISINDEQEIQEDELFLKNKYKYKTIVQCAKERLDVLGYGIDKFEILFNSNKYQAIDYTAFMNHLGNKFNDYEEYMRERIDKKITFKKWKNAMNKIVSYELDNGKINCWDDAYDRSFCTECEKVILYALKDYNSDSYYAINTEIIPLPYIFRLILESCENSDVIELDFSYLSYWDNDCIPKALEATEAIEKTIVLVEGTSDKNILEFSMSKLFPHLCDLFYFMDFGDNTTGKRDAGASYIVKNLKTFYFSI